MWIIIALFIIYAIYQLPNIFGTWSDMGYVEHLERMGVFTNKDGKEI